MPLLRFETVQRKFPEVRESYGKNGVEFNAHCPFNHRKGGIYKFYINQDSGTYFCQDCKRSGSAWRDFFDDITSNKYGHLKLLRDRSVVETGYRGNKFFASLAHKITWDDGKVLAPGETVSLGDLPEDHPAREYLISRGMDPVEFCDESHPFGALYCKKGQVEVLNGQCKSEGRIIYPVTQRGHQVGWTARTIDRIVGEGDDQKRFVWSEADGWKEMARLPEGKWEDHSIPKWFHLPSMNKSSLLYNFDEAKKWDTVVLSEGPFDIHKVGAFGAGYFGDILSKHQIRLVKNNWEDVILVPDRGVDQESKSFIRVLDELREACRVRVLSLTEVDDLGESTRQYNLKLIRELLDSDNE